jgi:GTP-binding protein
LGLGEPHPISSAHGDNVTSLVELALTRVPATDPAPAVDEPSMSDERDSVDAPIKVAIVGRPNVGKSTLVNTLLGEERVIAFDQPGTTRDSIYLDFKREGRRYTLIDTAGVRRRGKVTEVIEKFSVIKTLQAIEDANVVVLLLDAQQDVTEQDAHLAGYIVDTGRALVVGVNKWDGLPENRRDEVKREFGRKLGFLAFAHHHYISAKEGRGVGDLMRSVDAAYAAAMARLPTPKLTRMLQQACRASAAAPRRDGSSQAALCPPGRAKPASDHHSRQCARPYTGHLPPVSGTFLYRCVPTARDAA